MKYDDATVQDIIALLSIYALPRSCTKTRTIRQKGEFHGKDNAASDSFQARGADARARRERLHAA